MFKYKNYLCFILLPVSLSTFADVDTNHNGLIEIHTPAELNSIRNDLAGSSLSGNSTGCPTSGCIGYELTNDINFDTNGDGKLTALDDFWNQGDGWQPIIDFSGIFDGNNHQILNLHIKRDQYQFSYTAYANEVGLFSNITNTGVVRNLILSGELASVTGYENVGTIAGTNQGTLINIHSTIHIKGSNYVGGIVGFNYTGTIQLASFSGTISVPDYSLDGDYIGGIAGRSYMAKISQAHNSGNISSTINGMYIGGIAGDNYQSNIEQVFNTGNINAPESTKVGGIIGFNNGGTFVSNITNTYNTGSIKGKRNVGGITGETRLTTISHSYTTGPISGAFSNAIVGNTDSASQNIIESNTYWDTDTSTTLYSSNYSSNDNSSGQTTSQLKCPISPGDNTCTPALYSGWDTSIWDFRSNLELPILKIDADNDGIIDLLDNCPFDYDEININLDSDLLCDGSGNSNSPNDINGSDSDDDNDGIADSNDIYPLDTDNDGLTNTNDVDDDDDGINDNIDTTPLDTDNDGITNAIDADDDNDGINDALDTFPLDTDNDGITNNADSDDDDDGRLDAVDDCLTSDKNLSSDIDNDGCDNDEDIDDDNDGLIEITSLNELDSIRYYLDDISYFGSKKGCPNKVCLGYELSNDLNFDTDGSGIIDTNDLYWNNGLGWDPIGEFNAQFKGTFDGNYHKITNLYISRHNYSNDDTIGLFTVLANTATVRNLGLLNSHIAGGNGFSGVGSICGKNDGTISQVYHHGEIIGYSATSTGGITGNNWGTIDKVFNLGTVINSYQVGGIAGENHGYISNTFNAARISANGGFYMGGIVGLNNSSVTLSYNKGFLDFMSSTYSKQGGVIGGGTLGAPSLYWNRELTTSVITTGHGTAGIYENTIGLTTHEMKCPTTANNTSCKSGITIYSGWSPLVWNFGTPDQYPSLIFNGLTSRDMDSDGVDDEIDLYPGIPIGSLDDSDSDGGPDSCKNVNCNGMNDDTDDDNDFIPDSNDAYPNIPIALFTDYDKDGAPDYCSPKDCSRMKKDNCPADYNPVQEDNDHDGVGNICDSTLNGIPKKSSSSNGSNNSYIMLILLICGIRARTKKFWTTV